jgi:hypothetical protein
MNKPSIAWVFLLWFALLWWQGGFMFYSAIVVHIATDQLDSAFEQGKITARVMLWLNGLGTFTLILMLIDICQRYVQRKTMSFPMGLWPTWLLMVIAQVGLWKLREDMVAAIDYTEGWVQDKTVFHPLHEWYMRLTTLQWVCSLVYMVWLIARKPPHVPKNLPLEKSATAEDDS